jgi:O-antigen/teichoic acid export membrane protein
MTQIALPKSREKFNLEDLARNAVAALALQLAGVALTYLLDVFLAQWMGKNQYGIYVYVISWSSLLAIVAGLGLPQTVLRFISEYKVQQNWGSLRGIVRGSLQITLLASLFVCLGCAGGIFLLDHLGWLTYSTVPLLIGVGMIPLQALVKLQLDLARAIDDIVLAYAPHRIIWPVLVLLGGFVLLETHHPLTSGLMICVASFLLFAALLFQFWLIQEKIDRDIERVDPIYSYRKWIDVALSVLIQVGILELLDRTDILMIGSWLGPEEAGIYGAAAKTAMWVAFVLQTVNMVSAPAFAALYAQNDLKGLQNIVSTVAVWIFWPSLTVAFFLFVLARPVLGMFGLEFMAASWDLKILILGQIVNALCGSVGYLMVMTGHQNKSVKVFALSTLINIAGNAIAIPLCGRVGAAIATSITMIFWNIWLSVLVKKHIGIHTSIFYRFSQEH